MEIELPPAPEVLVLNGGDVGFWPEGWWHRVTSLPATRAVGVLVCLCSPYGYSEVYRMTDELGFADLIRLQAVSSF